MSNDTPHIEQEDLPSDDGDGADATRRRKLPQTVHFFLRGLAFSLPPILTVVILIWIANGIYDYIIYPTSQVVRFTIAQVIDESRRTEDLSRWEKLPPLEYRENNYRVTPQLKADLQKRLREHQAENPNQSPMTTVPESWVTARIDEVFVPFGKRSVPYVDYAAVARENADIDSITTSTAFYMELVTTRHFNGLFHLSAVAVIIIIVALYFLGRFVTARLGKWIVARVETTFLARLPVVSNVYSSVKQVTDFLFSERQVEYSRVVAIEYPRRGIWSLALVTGESMIDVTVAAGEPMVSVLVPSSPMPFTGYTMNIPRSEVLDLNISVDQAFQFCISCGVLVAPQQKVTAESLQKAMAKRFADAGPRLSIPGQQTDTAMTRSDEESPT